LVLHKDRICLVATLWLESRVKINTGMIISKGSLSGDITQCTVVKVNQSF
jgi:hypothetical protein